MSDDAVALVNRMRSVTLEATMGVSIVLNNVNNEPLYVNEYM